MSKELQRWADITSMKMLTDREDHAHGMRGVLGPHILGRGPLIARRSNLGPSIPFTLSEI